MDIIILTVWLVVALPTLYVLTVAMYGDLRSFLGAWQEWFQNGGPLGFVVYEGPPLGLVWWVILAFVLLAGEYGAVRRVLS